MRSEIKRFIQEVAVLHDEMQSGVVASQLLTEEGGNMVVLITSFTSRDECLAFHDSRPYRAFVQKTQHLLVGSFVVKMFTERMGT